MSSIAIHADRVSKHYRLGQGPRGQGDFREAAAGLARRALEKLRRAPISAPAPDRDLWALRDVSFDVRHGEVVGIVGHNGAGKSTLLKVLSRITDPTSGEAWYEGRVGSLLEVGTGFHPELSGRENVFLSGAILGMSRGEIAAKFDEIVEFSDMARFIDTPVKRYSSGMFVRLGFAVAAHLDPEILIVDEVLAVGDASFQRKCMAKMKTVASEGRTILFVSHNMASIQAMCDRAIVLKNGRIVAEGSAAEAAALYLRSTGDASAVPVAERLDRQGRGETRIVDISVGAADVPDAPGTLLYGRTAVFTCRANRRLPELTCSFTVLNQLAQRVARFSSRIPAPGDEIDPGGDRFVCIVPELPFVPGQYHLNVSLSSGRDLQDAVDSALMFDVQPGNLRGRALGREQTGVIVAPAHRWILPGTEVNS